MLRPLPEPGIPCNSLHGIEFTHRTIRSFRVDSCMGVRICTRARLRTFSGPQGGSVGPSVQVEIRDPGAQPLVRAPCSVESRLLPLTLLPTGVGTSLYIYQTRSLKRNKHFHSLKNKKQGIPGWLSGLAPAFGPGHGPGVPGSSPTSGTLHGACSSLCLCLCL